MSNKPAVFLALRFLSEVNCGGSRVVELRNQMIEAIEIGECTEIERNALLAALELGQNAYLKGDSDGNAG